MKDRPNIFWYNSLEQDVKLHVVNLIVWTNQIIRKPFDHLPVLSQGRLVQLSCRNLGQPPPKETSNWITRIKRTDCFLLILRKQRKCNSPDVANPKWSFKLNLIKWDVIPSGTLLPTHDFNLQQIIQWMSIEGNFQWAENIVKENNQQGVSKRGRGSDCESPHRLQYN